MKAGRIWQALMPTGEQGGSNRKPISPAKFWLTSALVIVVVGILLPLAWMPSRPEEPIYQGKPMREWLRAYADSHSGTEAHAQSEAALRKIGTNGIPTLLRLIQTPDSTLRTVLKGLIHKQSFIDASFQDAYNIRMMAAWAFLALGEGAKGAVPELLALVKRGSGTTGREEAFYALGHIGPSAQAAVPALLAIASDVKDPDRVNAISSLGLIRSAAESVVPFLTSCLRDSDRSIRLNAVEALGEFGEAAKSSVPELISVASHGGTELE